tara:strand:- start:1696 stop:1887 length:192 start_codon:yes stop_codon:yes gene_type:complete
MQKTDTRLCSICGKHPGSKKDNPLLWNGFRDLATGQLVCFEKECKEINHQRKRELRKKEHDLH